MVNIPSPSTVPMPTPAPQQPHARHSPVAHTTRATARRPRCLPESLPAVWPPPVTGSRPATLHAHHTHLSSPLNTALH
ncbi:hypothetical protein E2C01_099962 [Portunus trituberculatus]|uniref:Uncharacterized protein n=1 Tax=Portunus trituberculatus TaxID=210409 RepID=A0A5B7K6T8_PORTR|nr:hypothetical protein [Portunus trituberculatus]